MLKHRNDDNEPISLQLVPHQAERLVGWFGCESNTTAPADIDTTRIAMRFDRTGSQIKFGMTQVRFGITAVG